MKQLFNISNDAVIEPARSILLIELGEKYCCLIIIRRQDFEAERLVYYEADNEEKLLNDVFAAHHEFNSHFSEVLINYSFPQSVTVPSKYYSYGDGKKMLQVMHGDEQGEAVLAEHLPEWQMYNVYEVPKPVHGWISMRFHSGKYWHSYSSSLNNYSKGERDNVLLIDFKTGQFSVIVIKALKFQLAQTFAYTEPADVIYYLLRICDEFSLSQNEIGLVLSGFLEKDSSLYRELYNYFVNISFQPAPGIIRFPVSFRQYPNYFFSSVLNLTRCVS